MSFVRKTALVVGLLAAAAPALAQDSGRVRQIVVQGTQRIEVETVKSYMALAEGDPYDADRVDRSLKTLYNTGLFADVAIHHQGDMVVVRVVENPIINRIAFEGNKRIKEEELTQETQLRSRVVYTRTKVQNDVKRILDLYRRNGRFAATIEPKIIQLEQNRVDLVFEINEGQPTYVKRINFVGNHKYSDSRLREVLMTKEERWYRFFSSDDTYDPDRVTYDRELLRRFFLKHGYADFRVVSGVAELTPDREGFFITFTVDEGERYKFGTAAVNANLRDLKADELNPLLSSKPGDWYNADQVEDIVQKLTDALGSRGYAFVDVKPQINRDRDNKTINITYDIAEGPRVYVERIDISGNVRTLDKVIRREFKLVEGDAFNTAKLRRSRQRVKDLNFFEKAEVTNVPSETAPDRTVIKVDVQEKSTGELSFGVGWSTVAGPLVEVSMRERNLLGRGQDVRATASVGTKQNQMVFSFTEPYFLDRQLAAGFDVFATTRKLQRESSYDSNSLGGSLRAGYQISENLRQDWKYTLKRDQVENVSSTASTFIREQMGTSVMSSIQQTLLWDYRDSKVEPTEGYFIRLNNEIAGLGGDQQFLRNNVGGGQYFSLAEQVVLGLTGNVGVMTGFGDEKIRITERYFLGGDTLRGFANAGVSPRDKVTGDALGGLWQYAGSAQVKFPLGLPDELGFGGQVFSDFGSIGETENYATGGINQASTIRVSVGAGVTWKSPMGPVAVDIGFPLKKEAFDERELFRFNFGTRF
ncbi:MAG: outer membrane protein assembly factor BamA [Rhodospirillaceae bacterium]|nr:outer membrane protein assembly factor BamA [Rhodospirillales bacterium]